MRAMRFRFLAAAACVSAIATAGCNDSNTMTAPGPMTTGANVAGTWAGEFQSDSPRSVQRQRRHGFIHSERHGRHGFLPGHGLRHQRDLQGDRRRARTSREAST